MKTARRRASATRPPNRPSGPSARPGRLADAIARLGRHLDDLAAIDPAGLIDTDSLRSLERVRARIDGYVTLATRAFDDSRQWAESGAKSAETWLSSECGLPASEARRQVRRGSMLDRLPKSKAAWLQGELTGDHVESIGRATAGVAEDTVARDEGRLVEDAVEDRFERFTQKLASWAQQNDPAGAEARAQDQRERRSVKLGPSADGMFSGWISLDPISGAIVSDELTRLEKEFFDADWAEAKKRLGREPTMADIVRTPAQRRADALVEMATRSAAAPNKFRRPAPLFSVFVGYETLEGPILQLAQGIPITPGSLLHWLELADIERAVFRPNGRVEVSEKARFFTGGDRRAIQLRDQICQDAHCEVRADFCEVDHIIPYSEGGLTTQENGRLLCGFHNRLRNGKKGRPPDTG
ncbi:MAG TPA: DUF222 domain-containing protein [Acidimicrobiales bacterium]|nr:DUF222 domain-containing protein [Acidimicrobiales bacterium]